MVLFADASRMGFVRFRRDAALAMRLIGPGMLAAVGLGTVLAAWLFGALDWWECAALAVMLAPTDVSLCAPAVQDRRVPARVGFALTVESGVNDGPAVPLLLLCVAGATVAEGIRPGSFWATTALEKIGIGVVAGVLVGLIAGELVGRARQAGWSNPASEGLALAGVAVAVFVFTQQLGGSGLIAAFVAGVAATARPRATGEAALGFAETEGAVVATFVYFALGLVGVELLDRLTWRECAYAVLSLALVRPLSVTLALMGTKLRLPTIAFMSWFGPRGLASVVLALIVLAGEPRLHGIDAIALTALVTVLLSMVAWDHRRAAHPPLRRLGDGASPRRARAGPGLPARPHRPDGAYARTLRSRAAGLAVDVASIRLAIMAVQPDLPSAGVSPARPRSPQTPVARTHGIDRSGGARRDRLRNRLVGQPTRVARRASDMPISASPAFIQGIDSAEIVHTVHGRPSGCLTIRRCTAIVSTCQRPSKNASRSGSVRRTRRCWSARRRQHI